jgi:HAD superfamily hydrolase (TIGR01509 family)
VIPRFPVYLFDIDGTLVDSAPDITAAITQALAGTRQAGVPVEFLRTYIGRHLLDLFEHLLPEFSRGDHDRLIAGYRTIYLARGHTQTRLYPGVSEMIAALPGRKSTATTKGTATAGMVLEQFGLRPYFEHVQGTDGFPSKPEPDVILKALDALGARPEDCLMVGDSGPDMDAGRRAGVRTCAVRWGYGNHEEMARLQPDYWIETPGELVCSRRLFAL